MTRIEKIAQDTAAAKQKRLRAASSILGGATTGLFAGSILGKGTRAALAGAGLGALFGAAAEFATRDVEEAQLRQIDRWAAHWTPGNTAPDPYTHAQYGSTTRGRGRPVILRVARGYGRAS